jgi:hypothetical protein
MFNNFFSFENSAVYEIIWKNKLAPVRWKYGAWQCMLDTYGYKNTFSTRNIYCFYTAKMVRRKCLNVAWYVYCLAC